ncbi:hypothetical protein CTZ27_29055 [Streptomyces griseocarneus]|nr:hypothetical protein CTZ27_29055 [Streptomyces griseocarneus]
MLLRAATDGTAAGTSQAQISTAQRKFYSGTYAARVYFNDKPTVGPEGDHPVQTFYAISPENPLYSELDHEYLPNGGWGTPGASHFTTAWRGLPDDKETYNKNNAINSLQGWHTLQMTVDAGAVVFYVDGERYFSPDSEYYPREAMTINFNHWFVDLPFTGLTRSWEQKVNWVYYSNSGALTPEQVDVAVQGYYASGTHFTDTVPKETAHDYNGDGISDVSLSYDYGTANSSSCDLRGANRTAMFALTGKADYSGGLRGLTSQADKPCLPGRPKFVTSGDFNGDGRSDIATFHDYGSVGSTCKGSNHVVILEWLASPDGSGALQGPAVVWESTCWGGGTAFMESGDFNGDGKSDIALLYDYGDKRVRLFTLTASKNGDGAFGGLVPHWDGVNTGASIKFMTAGDYNGDGKGDIALFYDHGIDGATCGGPAHQSVRTLIANQNGDGGFNRGGSPAVVWESTCWGGGTAFMESGDFNGDGKSDIALLYDYGDKRVRLFTLTASKNGDGAFGGLVPHWDGVNTGASIKFMTAGDYNGDGKGDIALFYDHGIDGATCGGPAHQSVRTLIANQNGDGGFNRGGSPAVVWESTCWGGGTASMN